ncbi:aminoglycoside phosphotransferase family protein [Kitasatospora sp. NBC_00458]|uniref:aminoglycoside phosphotransferase family protein n=1 Tax=Kitasatospora sp. NBC_00458 TaxID=2903568 RepID=UPI002E183DB5
MGIVEIDERTVRALLREQHPDLAGLDLRFAATGWDNQQWRLGDDYALRLPRTERAPELLRKEQRWLPVLGQGLPLTVPAMVRTGEPSALFPRPWSIVTWVPGEPADRAPVTRAGDAADALAGFLAALHRPAPAGAPENPDRGVPLALLADGFEYAFQPFASDRRADAVREVWEQAVAAPVRQGPPRWLHGDLHPANVVVSDGTISGVIDFGELCAGDPATDVAAAWLLLPGGADERFLAGYPEADGAMIRRARGWAVLRALHLLAIGRAGDRGLPGGKPTWGPAGRAAIDRVLATA